MFAKTMAIMTMTLLVATGASAVELSYTWKKGDTHKFSFEDETSFQMSMGGMGGGMNATMKVKSVFTQKVLSVRPDGTADMELEILKLDLFQDGKKLAALTQIPPAARKVKAEVDRKGRAKFYKMVSVYIQDDRVYVGIHKASVGPHGASASASAGGPEGGVTVDVVASVDPNTGRVTAAMKVRERPPALKKVSIKQQDPAVDVLPKGIFEMMVMPEGSMSPGDEVEVKLPFVTTVVSLDAVKKKVATLKIKTKAKASSGQGGMPGMGDVPAMEGMPDMGNLPGMGAAGGGMKMNADVTVRFDTGAGKLLGMQGQVGMDMSMGGMGKVTTRSDFTLNRL